MSLVLSAARRYWCFLMDSREESRPSLNFSVSSSSTSAAAVVSMGRIFSNYSSFMFADMLIYIWDKDGIKSEHFVKMGLV